MLIGLYGSEIIASKLPLALPLAFTAGIVIESEGAFRLSGHLKRSGSDEELLQFSAKVEVKKSGAGHIPFKFSTVNFKEAGTYEIQLNVVDQKERITELFQVRQADSV